MFNPNLLECGLWRSHAATTKDNDGRNYTCIRKLWANRVDTGCFTHSWSLRKRQPLNLISTLCTFSPAAEVCHDDIHQESDEDAMRGLVDYKSEDSEGFDPSVCFSSRLLLIDRAVHVGEWLFLQRWGIWRCCWRWRQNGRQYTSHWGIYAPIPNKQGARGSGPNSHNWIKTNDCRLSKILSSGCRLSVFYWTFAFFLCHFR